MKRLSIVVAVALALGCDGFGYPERSFGVTGPESSPGAAGATAVGHETAGSETAGAGGYGGAVVVTSSERYCRELLDYQDAGGLWCGFDDGTFGESSEPSECKSCYLARCGADGFTYWVPVRCSDL